VEPARLRRICLFNAHPTAHFSGAILSPPEVTVLKRTAGPLMPSGRLCSAQESEARTLEDNATWRPWVLDQPRSPDAATTDLFALYLRNNALTGPESAEQYTAYSKARAAAIAAVAPYYRSRFGRTADEARRLAALYLDRLVAERLQLDADDEGIAALFAPDYAEKHKAQKAALSGDTDGLRAALGPEPQAVAKGDTGEFDEPLVTDSIAHSETLRALLDLGFDPDEFGFSGRTALMVAARLDLVEAARILLAHGAAVGRGATDAVAQTDAGGEASCLTGKTAPSDTPGRTALSYAAELASPEMVR